MKNDGGPAFPDPERSRPFSDYEEAGLTKRDYFAARAMNALCPEFEDLPGAGSASRRAETLSEIAQWAYEMADAMLKAREQ